jgi:DUF917 family protein
LQDEDQLPTVAGIGTPAVSIERPGGNMLLDALDLMSSKLDVKFTHILTTEIGGGNGLAALECGSSKYYNLPTVDGDCMGTAFA